MVVTFTLLPGGAAQARADAQLRLAEGQEVDGPGAGLMSADGPQSSALSGDDGRDGGFHEVQLSGGPDPVPLPVAGAGGSSSGINSLGAQHAQIEGAIASTVVDESHVTSSSRNGGGIYNDNDRNNIAAVESGIIQPMVSNTQATLTTASTGTAVTGTNASIGASKDLNRPQALAIDDGGSDGGSSGGGSSANRRKASPWGIAASQAQPVTATTTASGSRDPAAGCHVTSPSAVQASVAAELQPQQPP